MVYTIDYLDNIVINANEPCIKNNHAISYLQEGLIMLAKNVYIIEKQKLNTLQGECVLELTFNSEENRRLACFFHWFSVSLVSYIKLIALMDIMQINHWEFNDLKKNKKELKNM